MTAAAGPPHVVGLSAPATLLGAWVLLSLGITVNNGAYRTKAVAVITVGLLLVLVGCAALRGRSRSPDLIATGLAAAVGTSLAVSLSYDVGLYGSGDDLVRSRALSVLAAGCALVVVVLPVRWRPVAAATALMTGAAALVTMILSSPRPAIDVWFILTEGSRRLVAGNNLYTSCWPGNTDRLTDCVYPYLPMTSIVQTPFRLALGDVRYSYVLALLVVALLLWRLAGPVFGPALAVLVLVSPKISFLVEQAWTEPLLLLGMGVMVSGVLSGRLTLAVLGLAFALACKQHILLLLPLAAWWPQFGLRRTALSTALATVATLPWFLLDPRAFLSDALLFNLELEPRRDSLSLFTTALDNDIRPSFVVVAALSFATIAAAMALLPRTATGFVAGSALVQYVFDLLNKQSFFNHWWFVTGLLLLTVATAVREGAASEDEVRVDEQDRQQTEAAG